MIELAPNSKRGLTLRFPLILAGGYGNELAPEAYTRVGALVTVPTTLRPHAPARHARRVVQLPAGFLLNRAGANPGLARVLRDFHHAWRRLSLPVILALAAEDARNWAELAARAARSRRVSAIECEMVEELDAAAAVRTIRAETDLPLLAKLPLERSLELAELALAAGADALTLGIAPRGIVLEGEGVWEGRFAGPTLMPLVLRAIQKVAENFPEIPLIAAGGVQSAADVRDLMALGARAVQVDVALWRNPALWAELAEALDAEV